MKKTANLKIFRRKKRLGENERVQFNSELVQAFQGSRAFSQQHTVNDIASYVVKTYQKAIDLIITEY